MQNGYIESFNGKFRDECLNEQWFQDLHQAKTAIKVWRQDYNEVRPHSSCGRVPPAKFAELHRQQAGDAARTPSTTEINSPCNPTLPPNDRHGGRGQVTPTSPGARRESKPR
jgi:putative transposase